MCLTGKAVVGRANTCPAHAAVIFGPVVVITASQIVVTGPPSVVVTVTLLE